MVFRRKKKSLPPKDHESVGKPGVDQLRGIPPARTPLPIKLVAQALKEAHNLVIVAVVNMALPTRPRVSQGLGFRV